MCLSIAYENEILEETIIMRNVQSVKVEGEYVILEDLMERKNRIKGKLERIDLIENYVVISTTKERL